MSARRRFLLSLIVVAWVSTPFAQQEDDLGKAIEHARELNMTQAVTASQPRIDALMDRLREATPRQRVEIRLLHIRNLALQGHYEAAIEETEALLATSPDNDQRIRALRLATNLGINTGRYEWGLGKLKQALSLLSESRDPIEKSRVYSLAGFLHTLSGDHARSIHYSRRAFDIAVESSSVQQQCQAGQRLTLAYRYAEQFEQAAQTARRARADCLEVDNQVYLGTVELELAHLALEEQDLSAAEDWIEQGLKRLREGVWVDGILTGRQLQAQLAAARGQSGRAIQLARDLVDEVGQRELWEREAALHELMAEQYAQQGNYAAAYSHRLEQVQSHQRFLEKDRRRRLAILEVEFEVARHEQALALMRERQRVAELEAEARRQSSRLRNMLAVLVVLVFALVMTMLLRFLRERRHFRRLSQIDGLTRISNHTRFFDTARKMLDEARCAQRPFVLVLGDIDHFKQVNDEHGHIAGDRALRKVARCLCEYFPGAGTVGRVGGEEFAVFQLDADLTRVAKQLGNLQRSLADIEYGNESKGLTMSFGVAALCDGETLDQLRRRADEALYRAKRGGRDSVVIADNPDD